jgi:hypothetical protein
MNMAFRVVATVLFFIAALGTITATGLSSVPLVPLGLAFWCLSTLVP